MALQNAMLRMVAEARGTPGSSNTHDDHPNEMNRYMGGHRRFNHPFINGYWYLLVEPPQFMWQFGNSPIGNAADTGDFPYMDQGTGNGNRNGIGPFESSRWLHSTAEGFTPPTRTLTKVDVPGLGGMGSSFVAGQQLTRTFSCTFREYQDTPVFNAINLWTSVIDHHYGVSPMNGNQYLPANYKGSAYVFLCKPTIGNIDQGIQGIDVEQFYFFEGVFPESSPYDGFNSDINTNDVVQLNVTFSFDGWPYGREHTSHFERGMELMQTIYGYNFLGTRNNHADPVQNVTTLSSPTTVTSNITDVGELNVG